MSELERLRALLGEMTPGPWEAEEMTLGASWVSTPTPYIGHRGMPETPADVRGIAALFNLAPSLLAVVEAALSDQADLGKTYAMDIDEPLATLLADIRKELGE